MLVVAFALLTLLALLIEIGAAQTLWAVMSLIMVYCFFGMLHFLGDDNLRAAKCAAIFAGLFSVGMLAIYAGAGAP